jgi:hypothetical protein
MCTTNQYKVSEVMVYIITIVVFYGQDRVPVSFYIDPPVSTFETHPLGKSQNPALLAAGCGCGAAAAPAAVRGGRLGRLCRGVPRNDEADTPCRAPPTAVRMRRSGMPSCYVARPRRRRRLLLGAAALALACLGLGKPAQGAALGFPLGDGGATELWDAVAQGGSRQRVAELLAAGAEVNRRNAEMVGQPASQPASQWQCARACVCMCSPDEHLQPCTACRVQLQCRPAG